MAIAATAWTVMRLRQGTDGRCVGWGPSKSKYQYRRGQWSSRSSPRSTGPLLAADRHPGCMPLISVGLAAVKGVKHSDGSFVLVPIETHAPVSHAKPPFRRTRVGQLGGVAVLSGSEPVNRSNNA